MSKVRNRWLRSLGLFTLICYAVLISFFFAMQSSYYPDPAITLFTFSFFLSIPCYYAYHRRGTASLLFLLIALPLAVFRLIAINRHINALLFGASSLGMILMSLVVLGSAAWLWINSLKYRAENRLLKSADMLLHKTKRQMKIFRWIGYILGGIYMVAAFIRLLSVEITPIHLLLSSLLCFCIWIVLIRLLGWVVIQGKNYLKDSQTPFFGPIGTVVGFCIAGFLLAAGSYGACLVALNFNEVSSVLLIASLAFGVSKLLFSGLELLIRHIRMSYNKRTTPAD